MSRGSTTEKLKRKQLIWLGLDRGKFIENKYYLNVSLKSLIKSLKSERPISGTKNIKLLHDNAKPHVHINVKNYINSQCKLIDHPPYSPDLAPLDFWLVDEINRCLPDEIPRGKMASVITEVVNSIPKDEYQKTFSKLLERMRLCIETQGFWTFNKIKSIEIILFLKFFILWQNLLTLLSTKNGSNCCRSEICLYSMDIPYSWLEQRTNNIILLGWQFAWTKRKQISNSFLKP